MVTSLRKDAVLAQQKKQTATTDCAASPALQAKVK